MALERLQAAASLPMDAKLWCPQSQSPSIAIPYDGLDSALSSACASGPVSAASPEGASLLGAGVVSAVASWARGALPDAPATSGATSTLNLAVMLCPKSA